MNNKPLAQLTTYHGQYMDALQSVKAAMLNSNALFPAMMPAQTSGVVRASDIRSKVIEAVGERIVQLADSDEWEVTRLNSNEVVVRLGKFNIVNTSVVTHVMYGEDKVLGRYHEDFLKLDPVAVAINRIMLTATDRYLEEIKRV